jgi:glucosamine--fructose-6-phosphate aminotransferase (isomerizing)
MCGIVGYIGHRRALPLLLNGLRRLEYRGYDSAGIAVPHGGGLFIAKRAGTVAHLAATLEHLNLPATMGIGHTRWATHGEPIDRNAHPHTDATGRIAIVHNGIIENHAILKAKLLEDGYGFVSDTDTEVLAVFIGALYQQYGDLELAVRTALSEVEGTFGLVVLSADHPDLLIAARRGSPIVIGVGDGEYIVASDATAIVEYTRSVFYLSDDEMAVITRAGCQTKTIEDIPTSAQLLELEFDLERIEKGGFPHFMLRTAHDLPRRLPWAAPAPGGQRQTGWTAQRGGATAPSTAPDLHRLRNLLACCPGGGVLDRATGAPPRRSRIRLGVPLPQSGALPR